MSAPLNNPTGTIILKGLIQDKDYFGKVMPILKPKYFKQSDGSYQVMQLIKEYYGEYQSIPELTEIAIKAKSVPNIEIRTKIAEQLQSINNTKLPNNSKFMIDETVKYVKDAIFDEAIVTGAESLDTKNEDAKLAAWDLMERAFQVSVDTDLGLDYDDLEARIDYYQTELHGLLTTRFQALNKRLGSGFLPGTLSVILAASGVGKSLLMTSLISDYIQQGKNVLLVSMEMGSFEIVKRVDADVLDIPINDLSKRETTSVGSDFNNISMADRIRHKYKEVKEKGLGKFYTKQYAPGEFSSIMLENLLDSYRNEKSVEFDLVFLDYLGIMKSSRMGHGVGLYSYVKSITEEVRAVAVNRNIPIISASQLNRCLHGDSKISTPDGDVEIKDIKLGDVLLSNRGEVEVINKSKSKGKMYKITTKSGKTIMCSGEHKFPTNQGTMTINCGLQVGLKLSSL